LKKILPPSMPSKKLRIRLYADENIPIPSATYLKSKGISVIHAYDKNFVEKSDLFHLKQSKNLGRILISLDKDFKNISGEFVKESLIKATIDKIIKEKDSVVIEKFI